MTVFCCLLGSVLMLLYTFAGYPGLLWLRARLWPRPVAKSNYQPNVTIIIAAHNEERVIRRKLDSIFSSKYAPERLEVIVLSDGSTDATNAILSDYNDPRLHSIPITEHMGKASALNVGIREAKSDIVVFTDARQVFEKDCLSKLVANFADPLVGCVSGQLMIGDIKGAGEISGEHLKWKLENAIRKWEGVGGSVIGALGAFYAARHRLLIEIPPGTLLDDCFLPLNIVRQGYRTIFEEDARVWDDVAATPGQEFRRKVRTLTGNYQLLRLAPWLLSRRNPVRWEFVSHKLCRLLVPFLLALSLIASLSGSGVVYRSLAGLQVGVYALGVLAWLWPQLGTKLRLAEVARSVLVLNAATVMAFVNFVTGSYSVWVRESALRPKGVQTRGAQ